MRYNIDKREVNQMKAAVFALFVVAMGCTGVAAQRTVTNADLDKYRVQREAAQRDYRENYARMGFPSPEELQRQLEEDKLADERFAQRRANERLERDKAELAAMQAQQQVPLGGQTVVAAPPYDYYGGYNDNYGYGYPYYSYPNGYYGNRRYPRGYTGYPQQFPGYGSGGIFWPSPTPGVPIRTPGSRPIRRPR